MRRTEWEGFVPLAPSAAGARSRVPETLPHRHDEANAEDSRGAGFVPAGAQRRRPWEPRA
jgi:hypothetical protein